MKRGQQVSICGLDSFFVLVFQSFILKIKALLIVKKFCDLTQVKHFIRSDSPNVEGLNLYLYCVAVFYSDANKFIENPSSTQAISQNLSCKSND